MANKYTKDIGETEIYLKDLIFYLARRWRSLLAVILIGVLLGSIFSVVRSMGTTLTTEEEFPESTTEEEFPESYEVDGALAEKMELAAQYRMMYNRQLKYVQNSIYMQIDTGDFYMGVVAIYLSAGENTGKVSTLYHGLLYESSMFEDMAEALEYDGDISFLSEVFDVESRNFNEDSAEGFALAAEEDYLTYKVKAIDEKSCKTMLAVIQDYITEIDEELKEVYEDYSFEIILSGVYEEASKSVETKQQQQMADLNTYYKRMTELEADFIDDDLEYYQSVYLMEEIEDGTILEPEEPEEVEGEENPESSEATTPHISVEWILLGVIGMIVLWGIVLVIKYLMDESIKTGEEIKDTYHLPVLGRIDVDDTSTGIDGWLVSFYRRTEEPEDSVSYIASVIKTMQVSGIALCGAQEKGYIHSLMENLLQSSCQVELMPYISNDDQALKRATELGKEILVVEIGRTTRTEMKRELELCELQNIEILGVIVIDNA